MTIEHEPETPAKREERGKIPANLRLAISPAVGKFTPDMSQTPQILYCHCHYAQVVPKEVKEAVLRKLCESGVPFEAVADLCEMSARRDPALQRLTQGNAIKVAACYPRAVKWLFAAANAPLPLDKTEVLNMRVQPAEEVAASLLSAELKPNVPTGKVTAADAPKAAAT